MLADIKEMTGPDTLVLSLLNGVSSEEIIGKEIGMVNSSFANPHNDTFKSTMFGTPSTRTITSSLDCI